MDVRKELRRGGYRVTRQRRVVFDILAENEGRPLNIEDIHRLAEDRLPGIGVATVYRTLELFRDLGVVLPVHLHEDSQYYEIDSGDRHHHLVCNRCGAVQTLNACVLSQLLESVGEQSGFLVESHCLSLFGICEMCAEETGRSGGRGIRGTPGVGFQPVPAPEHPDCPGRAPKGFEFGPGGEKGAMR